MNNLPKKITMSKTRKTILDYNHNEGKSMKIKLLQN